MEVLINSLKKHGITEDAFYILLTEALIVYTENQEEQEEDERIDGFLDDIYKHAYRRIFAQYGLGEEE